MRPRTRRGGNRPSTCSTRRPRLEERDRSPTASRVHQHRRGVANVAIRHGADPRDFTLVAYGAAGPMLLPPALDLLHVRRIIVPPHPGLLSALGLLSSDLVYSDSRSSYVCSARRSRRHRRASSAAMERRLREPGWATRRASVRRSFDGRLSARAGRRRSSRCRPGRSTRPRSRDRAFHAAYERRYGNRFELCPCRVSAYRVRARDRRSDKVEFTASSSPRRGTRPPAPKRTSHARRRRGHCPGGRGVRARGAADRRPAFAGPAVIREGLSTTQVVCPASSRPSAATARS